MVKRVNRNYQFLRVQSIYSKIDIGLGVKNGASEYLNAFLRPHLAAL